MMGYSRGQSNVFNTESYSQQINLVAKIVRRSRNIEIVDDLLNKLVNLRMSMDFMKFMMTKYPDILSDNILL